MKKKPTKVQLLRAEARKLQRQGVVLESISAQRQLTDDEVLQIEKIADEMTRLETAITMEREHGSL